ncbi:methylenetetrahydrofolate reductase [Adhaeribacter sp. BT258]|uniref:Methylenetetrahydrofolate reductase n=1 Tax=Adhaeribacter terrigena TaxID=2793070 RepID=A0ABS1C3C8_9BACT|nr:methylenetetrahydrofolate reductase [Adhaeribacter terrigena]MBK0403862.1 methylenetetrahydrofolate reductase [Adhaeribacter terrigena]
MHITELLKQTTGRQFSLEILPKPGMSTEENLLLYQKIFARKPLFVDVPYHAARSNSGFSGEKDSVLKARPKTKSLAETLIGRYALMPQPHILCTGFTPEETETVLLQLHQTGVRNLLLLRGDISGDKAPKPRQHAFAYQLVEQVKKLNNGINFRNEKSAFKTDFCIGVGGYPEPAENFELSVQYLKQKVAAGADFIITQFFFDNSRFFAFEKACRNAGISVPIFPGISPLVSLNLLQKLPAFFKVSVPAALQRQINNCTGKAELEETGIHWAVEQASELYEKEFKCVHFFALSPPRILEQVLSKLF